MQKEEENKNKIELASNYVFEEGKKDRFDTDYFNTFMYNYPLQKKYFELFVCKILRPEPVYAYVEKETSLSNDIVLYSQSKIIETFKHLNFIDFDDNFEEIEKSFIMEWISSGDIRIYNKLDFIPYNKKKPVIDNIYNLFRGYNPDCKAYYDILKKDKLLKPFKDLWLQLCGGNVEHFQYFYNYLGHLVQYPEERIPICFIFKGKQGTGKNVALKAIGNLVGNQHYISSCNPKDFLGEYAEGFLHKLIVNMNECEGKDTFDFEGKIKGLISDDTVTINQKYIRPIVIAMLARIIIFTNKPNPIPIDVKSKERRFVVYQTTDYYLDSKYGTNFWSNIVKHFNRPDFIACLYNDLNELKIDDIDWKGKRPITEAYKEMCKLYVPPEILFFEDYCVNKITINHLATNVYVDSIDISEEGTDLYKQYNEFCSKFKFSRGENGKHLKSFYGKITELELPVMITNPHNIKTYKFNTKQILTYLKERGWIDKSDDDIINTPQDITGDNFDDEFNI
jgi:hypothetical protein